MVPSFAATMVRPQLAAVLLLSSLQASFAFFGSGVQPKPRRDFDFGDEKRNGLAEDSRKAKRQAALGLPVAHQGSKAEYAMWSQTRADADSQKNEEAALDVGETHMDGCLTAHHVDVVRSKCGHFVKEGAAMGDISCATCAKPLPGMKGCSKKEIYRICGKMLASSFVAKQQNQLQRMDYVGHEFKPKGGFESAYGEIGACLLSKVEEITVIVADMVSCEGWDAGKAMKPNSRCYAYSADDLAKRVRECCVGFEKVVVGRRAEMECKHDVLQVVKDIFQYVKPPFDFAVKAGIKRQSSANDWREEVTDCSDTKYRGTKCVFSVLDFMHPAFHLIQAATKFYAWGSARDKTKKAHNLLTLCDAKTMARFDSDDELVPGTSFIQANPQFFPVWKTFMTDAKWKKKDALMEDRPHTLPGVLAQSICIERLFQFSEKHGSAFGDPLEEGGDPDDPNRAWRRLRGKA